jgi:PhzF family phenazine biosynthesis protein
MKLTLYQVDAFTDKLFGGNPAAVIPLENWIADDLMQKLALENNLSENCFFSFLRAKTMTSVGLPLTAEINLCGHATLASAFVLYHFLKFRKGKIIFSFKSGKLEVQ